MFWRIFLLALSIGTISTLVWPRDNLELSVAGRWPGGPNYAVATDGQFLYRGMGGFFEIFDISNPLSPQLIGKTTIPSQIQYIVIRDGIAYAGGSFSGFYVIDVSNPLLPSVVRKFDTHDQVQDIAFADQFAFVANGDRGFQVLNLSNPTDPEKIKEIPVPGVVHGVAVSRTDSTILLLLACDWGGFRIFDITSPDSLFETGFVAIRTEEVKIYRGLAYLSANWGDLAVVDFQDPAHPFIRSTFEPRGYLKKLSIRHNQVFGAISYGNQFEIINIRNPGAPYTEGFCTIKGHSRDITLIESHAYLANGVDGTRVINVVNPSRPRETRVIPAPESAMGVIVSGNYAFTLEMWGGLRVFNIENPGTPEEVGFYDFQGFPQDIAIKNRHVYVADMERGLRIIDISNPSVPVEERLYDHLGRTRAVEIRDNLLYIINETHGFSILDINDPLNPILLGSYTPNSSAYKMALDGNYLFLAEDYSGLRIIDISDPMSPQSVGFCDSLMLVMDIHVQNNCLLVTAGYSGLWSINIADPANPLKVNLIANESFNQIEVTRNFAIVSENSHVLRLYDIVDPISPKFLGSFLAPGNPSDMIINYDYTIASIWDKGLLILHNDIVSAISPNESKLTRLFSLQPNYPNPFNPTTRISFFLPGAGRATLKIYDLQGKLIATLWDGLLQAGEHHATFDAGDLPSGIYFYQLKSGDFKLTKKMTLIR